MMIARVTDHSKDLGEITFIVPIGLVGALQILGVISHTV